MCINFICEYYMYSHTHTSQPNTCQYRDLILYDTNYECIFLGVGICLVYIVYNTIFFYVPSKFYISYSMYIYVLNSNSSLCCSNM